MYTVIYFIGKSILNNNNTVQMEVYLFSKGENHFKNKKIYIYITSKSSIDIYFFCFLMNIILNSSIGSNCFYLINLYFELYSLLHLTLPLDWFLLWMHITIICSYSLLNVFSIFFIEKDLELQKKSYLLMWFLTKYLGKALWSYIIFLNKSIFSLWFHYKYDIYMINLFCKIPWDIEKICIYNYMLNCIICVKDKLD